MYNAGTLAATDAVVRFYLGDPGAGGSSIGEARLTVASQASQLATLNWTPAVTGEHYLYVVADADNLIAEWSEENDVRRAQVLIAETYSVYLPVVLRGH